MIPIEEVKTLTPGTRLYQVVVMGWRNPEDWECAFVIIESIGPKTIIIKERSHVLNFSRRTNHEQVSKCCSLSRREAWEHCLKNCKAQVKSLRGELTSARQTADFIQNKITDMNKTPKNKGGN